MTQEHETEQTGLGRRGALAAILGTAAVATAATEGRAAPVSNVRGGALSARRFQASPLNNTIASLPLPGRAYRTLWYLDFLPLNPMANERTFAGSGGAYSTVVMEASVEIPAGALLRDVEWYVANSSGGEVWFYCAVWTPADGFITLFAPTIVPTGAGALTATRTVIGSDAWGPYPDGAKIVLYAPTSATCLLNGVRLGFINGGLEYSISTVPVTVYNSAVAGGKFAANETRVVTLSTIANTTSAAVLRVSATESTTAGMVKIYPGNEVAPSANALSILPNAESVGEVTVAMATDRSRQLKIAVTKAVHIKLDLVGTLR